MPTLNRRQFLRQSMGAATAMTVLSGASVLGANERIVVGLMGVGGRGTSLLEKFAARQDVAIAYVCDPDARRVKAAAALVAKAQGRAPKALDISQFRATVYLGKVAVSPHDRS